MVNLKDGPNVVNKKCGIQQKNDLTIICEMVFKIYNNGKKYDKLVLKINSQNALKFSNYTFFHEIIAIF